MLTNLRMMLLEKFGKEAHFFLGAHQPILSRVAHKQASHVTILYFLPPKIRPNRKISPNAYLLEQKI